MDRQKWESGVWEIVARLPQQAAGSLESVHVQVKRVWDDARSLVKKRRKGGSRGWWSREIQEAIKVRKLCSRNHRRALGEERRNRCEGRDSSQRAWQEYKVAKERVQMLIQNEMRRLDQSRMKEILGAPRGNRSKLFWDYIRGEEKRVDGKGSSKAYTVAEMNAAMKKLFCTGEGDSGVPGGGRSDTGIRTTVGEIKKVVSRMKTKGAAGPDGISLEMMEFMGDIYWEYLVREFNSIFAGEALPKGWGVGRIALIPKDGVDNEQLENRRPITITAIAYRIFMRIYKDRVQNFLEGSGLLGEWQCGFRKGRKLEDHIFILSQVVEMSRLTKQGCIAAFLDLRKAYDMVDRRVMYGVLEREGIPTPWIELLGDIYTGNKIVLQMGGVSSEYFSVERGLRQGCPASSILFLAYIEGVARGVYNSGLGWTMGRNGSEIRIPILLFADDMVLLGRDTPELQKLLDICGGEAQRIAMEFNEKKSAVVVFQGHKGRECLSIAGKTLPFGDQYKYLGITFCNAGEVMKAEGEIKKRKAEKGRAIVKAKALWSFSKFVVTRDIWRAVFVPAIGFADAVVVLGTGVQDKLEKIQREVIRYALGCRFTCAREFLEGEGGVKTFKEREVTSKLGYWIRIRDMNAERWVSTLQRVKRVLGLKTKWDRRVEYLARVIGYNKVAWEQAGLGVGALKNRVTTEFESKWQLQMKEKSSLGVYREDKKHRGGVEELYDNSRGSGLLADARAGMLNTRVHRAHFLEVSPVCPLCHQEEETVEHVVIGCSALGVREGLELGTALGLGAIVDWEEVRRTKQRLSGWETWVGGLEHEGENGVVGDFREGYEEEG